MWKYGQNLAGQVASCHYVVDSFREAIIGLIAMVDGAAAVANKAGMKQRGRLLAAVGDDLHSLEVADERAVIVCGVIYWIALA